MGKPKGCASNIKGKVCISKPGEKKYIDKSELDYYLSIGYVKGYVSDKQKSQNKKWYNNGIKNKCIKEGDVIPEGFKPGRIGPGEGNYKKFQYKWYTNGVEQKRFSILLGDTIPDGWVPGFSQKYKDNMSKVLKEKGNFHLNNKEYSEEYKNLYHDKEKFKNFVLNHSEMTLEELSNRFNCSEWSLYSILNTYDLQKYFSWYGVKVSQNSGTSFEEKKIFEYIKSIYTGNIIENYRKLIPPLEVDIYIPEKNIAIEYNGTYWHSTLCLNDKYYHLNKSLLCQEKGVRLIHIYGWELEEPYWHKIQYMLKESLGLSKTIYARQCEIKQISNAEAKKLNEEIHLQGHRNAQITYGLFYKNELVQLMSFSHSKYNKNIKNDSEWEIIRGCPGSNTSVVGGVSKLLTHFIRDYSPTKIFSYCDFNKFSGVSYEKIGMRFVGYTGPNKTWIVDKKPVNRNPKKYKYLKDISEGIIWGSGSKKYELDLNY